jgi:hypothetical protein
MANEPGRKRCILCLRLKQSRATRRVWLFGHQQLKRTAKTICHQCAGALLEAQRMSKDIDYSQELCV